MKRDFGFGFRALMIFLLSFSVCMITPQSAFSAQPIIIDHTCTDIRQIPESAIDQAKINLHIAYGHTSHGSQLTTGMTGLVGFANNGGLGLALPTDIFAWNNGGTGGALDLHDTAMAADVGYFPQWVNETRNYLNNPSHSDVNVIIWSWCGQVGDKYAAGTLTSEYLTPMSQLEADYPGVRFVYMTGHVDHWDDADNKAANQMIRDYCTTNDKVLYDFADIESYDPDGTFYEFPSDNCDYYESVSGPQLGNWAIEWQNSHTEGVDWYNCTSAHSQPLNANRKAYAAWWLWARLAGWNPNGVPVANFSGSPTSGTAPLAVSFADSSAGDIDSWSWTFGDGGTSTEQNPMYTYNDPGTYTVSLTVTGPTGSDTEFKTNFIRVWSEQMRLDVEAFVTRFYQQCLGRNPDHAGLEGWVTALLVGSLSGSDVAYGFVFSQEFLNKKTTDEEFLQVLYEAFFNRQPDSAGKQGWLDVLNTGISREDVLNGFIYAAEYAVLCDEYGIKAFESLREAVEAFVTRFYQLCLDRHPDAAGLEGWTNNLLNQIQTGADVANGFIYSQEFINKNTTNDEYLTILYKAFFNRPPDQAGWDVWLAELNVGKERDYILDGFLGSQEFINLCEDYGITPH